MLNQSALDFSLLDQDSHPHSLSMYKGKWLLLYFYPKDDTPGCTKEACNFRDSFHELQRLGVSILGISKDSVESHKKFSTKYNLNFPLLSDLNHEIIEKYDSWGEKKFMGRVFLGIIRSSYLINPDGKIVKVYPKVNPTIHADEIISDVKSLQISN